MIDKRILSKSQLLSILPVELFLSWEESEHPRGKAGKFAKKGQRAASKIGGRQYSRGKQRFSIDPNESEAEAYKRALSEAQKKRLKKQGRRTLSRSQFQQGVKDWEQEAKRQEYEDIRQASLAGEEHPKVTLAKEVTKEAGIAYGIHKVGNIAKGAIGKFTNKVKDVATPDIAKSKATKKLSKKQKLKIARSQTFTRSAEEIKARASGASVKAKAAQAAKAAYKGGGGINTAREYYKKAGGKAATQGLKSLAKEATGVAATSVATTAGVQAGSKILPFIGKAALAIGGTVLSPQFAIPAAVIGTATYLIHKRYKANKREQDIIAHERELMRQESNAGNINTDDDREFHKQLREQTAREVARQASIYATKQYAKSQVEHQKREIDEAISAKPFQRKMKRSARITAYAAAKEYSGREREQAYKTRGSDKLLYFAHKD